MKVHILERILWSTKGFLCFEGMASKFYVARVLDVFLSKSM